MVKKDLVGTAWVDQSLRWLQREHHNVDHPSVCDFKQGTSLFRRQDPFVVLLPAGILPQVPGSPYGRSRLRSAFFVIAVLPDGSRLGQRTSVAHVMYSTVCDAQKTCYASRLSTQAWARHTACCPQLVRCKPKRSCCTSVATRIASNTAASTPVTLQEFDDFELLWLEYRHGLSISKEVALWALEDVQLGLLPCDAELLRDRAQQLTGLPQTIPKLDSRRLLNTSRSLLKYGSG